MLFHITDCINTASVGVVTKRLQCLQVMFKFSVDLIERSGFFLPPLYINKTVELMSFGTFILWPLKRAVRYIEIAATAKGASTVFAFLAKQYLLIKYFDQCVKYKYTYDVGNLY